MDKKMPGRKRKKRKQTETITIDSPKVDNKKKRGKN